MSGRLRYRLASAVQKCCRRGLTSLAGQLAVALEQAAGPGYARYRLQICALEDATADVEQACLTVLACRNLEIGVAELAERVARLTKSRLADFLLILRGTEDVKAMVEQAKSVALPPAVALVADMSGLEQFPAILPAVYDLTKRSDGVLVQDSIPDSPMIGGVPACALDFHTGEGKRAFGYAAKSIDPLRAFLEQHPIKERVAAIGDAVFEVEGGLLDCRLTSPDIEALHDKAVATWVGPTVLGPDKFAELKQIIAGNLDRLNEARRRIVRAMDEEAALKARTKATPSPPTNPPPQDATRVQELPLQPQTTKGDTTP